MQKKPFLTNQERKVMEPYLSMARAIMEHGQDVDTRNGKVRKLFAIQRRFNILDGFPAMTTKKLAFNIVAGELIWFLEAGKKTGFRLDNNRLREILGYRLDQKTIWSEDCESSRWRPKTKFLGDCGRIYGAQWRNWSNWVLVPGHAGSTDWIPDEMENRPIDQLAIAIKAIKENPWDRQNKIVTARNPAEIDDMCLPACHERFQFFVGADSDGQPKTLSLHMVQRSCDVFLGVPFNIASYALLLEMVAQVCNLRPSELIIDFMDVHVYHIHFEQMEEQLRREPLPLPRLWLNPEVKDIDGFIVADVRLDGYNHHGAIKAELAKDKSDIKA
ncbi:MAG: thymidylate synthase [bacterium]|nr:thymidylate synthase [bacterium]